jgi:hypothetical protein
VGGASANSAAGGASVEAAALPWARRCRARGPAIYNPLGNEDGSEYEVYILPLTPAYFLS